jgi:hypothetical protein
MISSGRSTIVGRERKQIRPEADPTFVVIPPTRFPVNRNPEGRRDWVISELSGSATPTPLVKSGKGSLGGPDPKLVHFCPVDVLA